MQIQGKTNDSCSANVLWAPYRISMYSGEATSVVLAKNIRHLREARGWSQEELAERANASSVAMIESGQRRNPRMTTLEKIAGAFEVDVATLLQPNSMIDVPVVRTTSVPDAVVDSSGGGLSVQVSRSLGVDRAIVVHGDGWWPVLREGDTLLFASTDMSDRDVWFGKRCVVRVGGQLLIKIVERGSSAGVVRLTSFRNPPTEDAVVEWAAPIRLIESG